MQCDIPLLHCICRMMLRHRKAWQSDGHGWPVMAPDVLDVKTHSKGSCDWSLQRLERVEMLCLLQSTNLENAQKSLEKNGKELAVMKDFTTTTEVSLCCAISCEYAMQ